MSTLSSGSPVASSPTPRSGWSRGSTRSGCGADASGDPALRPSRLSVPSSGRHCRQRRLCRHEAGTPHCYPRRRREDVGRLWHRHRMTHKRQLRGVELRYALTLYLFQHGPKTVAELIEALEYQGFDIPGRSSKVVSDALRREINHGRVLRLKRGRYGPGEMPRATEYRIHQRVLSLRSEAAVIASQNDDSFWDSLFA